MSKAQEVDEIIHGIRMIWKTNPKGEDFVFWDLSAITMNPRLFKKLTTLIADQVEDIEYDIIAGAEARGFMFGASLILETGKPFAMVRKQGKLPWYVTGSGAYMKEYGADALEMNVGDVQPGSKVIIFDDILATGGTALSIAKMVESAGGIVAGFVFAIVLQDLPGILLLREKGYKICSVIWSKEERDDVSIYKV